MRTEYNRQNSLLYSVTGMTHREIKIGAKEQDKLRKRAHVLVFQLARAEAELDMWRKEAAVDWFFWWERRSDEMWQVVGNSVTDRILGDGRYSDALWERAEPAERLQKFIERGGL